MQLQARVYGASKLKSFLIDDEDYSKIQHFNWFVMPKGDIATTYHNGQKTVTIRLHRLIMDCPLGLQVDHINGERKDNRKSNLRICTNAENCRNKRKLSITNTTGARGVSPAPYGKFLAIIGYNGHQIYLGSFSTVEEARQVYNKKAKEYFGEFYSEV